jgi:hypothetical protein
MDGAGRQNDGTTEPRLKKETQMDAETSGIDADKPEQTDWNSDWDSSSESRSTGEIILK